MGIWLKRRLGCVSSFLTQVASNLPRRAGVMFGLLRQALQAAPMTGSYPVAYDGFSWPAPGKQLESRTVVYASLLSENSVHP